MSRIYSRPAPPDFTPGPWSFEPADSGDDSVGIPPSPPYVYADPDGDGNAFPVCALDDPIRRADRDPVDEYDECLDQRGTAAGNGALIAGAPVMFAALAAILDPARRPDEPFAQVEVVRLREIAREAIEAIEAIAKGGK